MWFPHKLKCIYFSPGPSLLPLTGNVFQENSEPQVLEFPTLTYGNIALLSILEIQSPEPLKRLRSTIYLEFTFGQTIFPEYFFWHPFCIRQRCSQEFKTGYFYPGLGRSVKFSGESLSFIKWTVGLKIDREGESYGEEEFRKLSGLCMSSTKFTNM